MANNSGRSSADPRSQPECVGLPRFFDTMDLARRFRCHPRTIRDWINHGCPTGERRVKLPAVRLGKKWQVREDWLVLFEHRVRPQGGRPELDLE